MSHCFRTFSSLLRKLLVFSTFAALQVSWVDDASLATQQTLRKRFDFPAEWVYERVAKGSRISLICGKETCTVEVDILFSNLRNHIPQDSGMLVSSDASSSSSSSSLLSPKENKDILEPLMSQRWWVDDPTSELKKTGGICHLPPFSWMHTQWLWRIMFSISISWNIVISLNHQISVSERLMSTSCQWIHLLGTCTIETNQSSWVVSFTISQTVVVSSKCPRKRNYFNRAWPYRAHGLGMSGGVMHLAVFCCFHMCNH